MRYSTNYNPGLRTITQVGWLTLLLLVAFVLVGGCRGEQMPVEPTGFDTKEVEAVSRVVESQDDNHHVIGEARRGGVLSVYTNHCTIIDPAIDRASSSLNFLTPPLVWEIHAGLMRVVDDSIDTVTPELAENYTVSEEGRLYSFVLRQDLRFSDGSPLTTSDVKWSWERALRMSTGTSRANDIFGNVQGADDIASGLTDELTGVELVDDRTMHIRLTHPLPDFPALLGDPVASVVMQENFHRWSIRWNNEDTTLLIDEQFNEHNMPVGAGPFRLQQYVLGATDKCALARNEHYWDPMRPLLDGIILATDLLPGTVGEEVTDITDFDRVENEAFEEGVIDYAYVYPDVAERVLTGEELMYGELQRIEREAYVGFLAFNPASLPFDDVHLRRALQLSADVSTIFPDNAIPISNRLLPPSMASSTDSIRLPEYDLESALSELATSRYANELADLSPRFITDTRGYFTDALIQLFADWRERVGVDISHEFNAIKYWNAVDNGTHQLRLVLTSPQYPSPHAVLRHFYSLFGVQPSDSDLSQVRRMMSDAAIEPDAAERLHLYEEIEAYLLDRALVLPLFSIEDGIDIRVQPWVNDLQFSKYPGSIYKDVWLDQSAPKRDLPIP